MLRVPQHNRVAVGVRREKADAATVGDQGVDTLDDALRIVHPRDGCPVNRADDGELLIDAERSGEVTARGEDRRGIGAWLRPTLPITRLRSRARGLAPLRALGFSRRGLLRPSN